MSSPAAVNIKILHGVFYILKSSSNLGKSDYLHLSCHKYDAVFLLNIVYFCNLSFSFIIFYIKNTFPFIFIEVRNIVSKVILQYLNELILYSNISFRSVQPFSSVFSWLLLFFWCVALRPDWRCNRWCVWDGRLLPCRILHHHTLSCWLLQWNDWSVSFYLNCFLLSKFEL